LVHRLRKRPLVRHAPLDALGHQLAAGFLEVAVAAAGPHGADAPHAAVHLVAAALVDLGLARALVGPCEQAAEHDNVGAGGDRLEYVPGVTDAPVADDRDAVLHRHPRAIPNRGDLRHSDPGHHPGSADAARAEAHLDGVGAVLD